MLEADNDGMSHVTRVIIWKSAPTSNIGEERFATNEKSCPSKGVVVAANPSVAAAEGVLNLASTIHLYVDLKDALVNLQETKDCFIRPTEQNLAVLPFVNTRCAISF